MSNWNPGGQPPPGPPGGYNAPPPGPPHPPGGYNVPPPGPYPHPGPYPPGPYPQPGPYQPQGNGVPAPHVPHPYPPHPGYPHPGYPQPVRPPGPLRRLLRRIGPINTARRVFKPSRTGLVADEAVARMQKTRTAVGLCAVAWVSLSYKLTPSLSDVASDRANQSWITVLMLAVTLPVALGVLLALTAPDARRQLLRRALRCLGAMVALIAAAAVFPASVLTGFVEGRLATNPVMTVLTYAGLLVTFVWVLPFVLAGVGLALMHVFRTADIHQTVPPLLTMIVAWEMTLVDLFTGAYAGVPGPVRALMVLGAPASVTAVGLWELHRLRVHYGIAVRGMLTR
ncbi:hypothetical protein [Streptomyces sp. NPDC014805]|uniref:hypothetical protein n=1 Tax=Streptomyces sp. NPDC014805 TaxID=3364919 RepID=UPI0036FFA4B1